MATALLGDQKFHEHDPVLKPVQIQEYVKAYTQDLEVGFILLVDLVYYSISYPAFVRLFRCGLLHVPKVRIHERGISFPIEQDLFTEFALPLNTFIYPNDTTLTEEVLSFLEHWCVYKSHCVYKSLDSDLESIKYRACKSRYAAESVFHFTYGTIHYYRSASIVGPPPEIAQHKHDRSVFQSVQDSFSSLSALTLPAFSFGSTALIIFVAGTLTSFVVKWFVGRIIALFNPEPVEVVITFDHQLQSQNKKYESGQPTKDARQSYQINMPQVRSIATQGGFTKFVSKSMEAQLAVIMHNEFDAVIEYTDPEKSIVLVSSKFLIRFYAGTTFGTNYHSLHYALTHPLVYSTLIISKGTYKSLPIPFDKMKIARLAQPDDAFIQDLVFCNIPPRFVNARRDIHDYFPKRSEITDDYLYNVSFITPDYQAEFATAFIRPLESGRFEKRIVTSTDLRDGTHLDLSVVDAVSFPGLSHAGQCNSLYVTDNPKITKPWFATHDAGDKMSGRQYASLLFQELIQIGLQGAEPSQQPLSHPLTSESIATWYVAGTEPEARFVPKTTLPVAMLDKPFNHHINHKNDIIRTPLFPLEKPTKSPASQSVQAFANIIEKLNSPDFRVINPMYDIVALKYQRRLLKMVPVTPIHLSLDQVLNGPKSSLQSHPMRRLTSAGFLKPLCLGKPGKAALISEDPHGLKTPTPLLTTILENFSKEVDAGVPASVEQINIKIELRTNDRVEAENSRGYFANDPRAHITCSQEFGAFFAAMQANPLLSRCVIGIEPGSSSWGKLIGSLRSNGYNLVQADIKANDIRAHRYSILKVFSLIEAWYQKYDTRDPITKAYHTKRRYHLTLSAVSRLIQVGSLVFQNDHGVGSGRDNTSHIVSLLRHIDSMAINARLLFQHYPESATEILNNDDLLYEMFPSIHYGDDSIGSVHPQFPLINNITRRETAKREHDLDYTTVLKSTDESLIPAYYKWEDLDFLSRNCIKLHGSWMSQLREDTINNIPYWRKNDSVPNPEKCVQLVESALVEWFQYGETRFNLERTRYNSELARLRYPQSSLTYEKVYSDWHANY
jgi:hypothetical protein